MKINLRNTFHSVHDPFPDKEFELGELQLAIKECKNRKSPGLDKIPNEVYKHLTPIWEHYILNMFNVILEKENIPKMWSKIQMTMLHKKGDRSLPDNYV